MPFDSSAKRQSVVLLVPDIADTITRNRVEAFVEAGHHVVVMGFRRGRYSRADPPGGPPVVLGRTADARYLQRLWALVRAVPAIVSQRAALRKADSLYARNIDQLVLAMIARLLLRARAQIFYEVLDIQPAFAGRGVLSRLLRLLERLCLRHVRLLVLSSPGFYFNYFSAIQRYRGRWFLLENKLPPSVRLVAASGLGRRAPAPDMSGGWKIGYFGLIRGHETIDLIVRLAQRLRGRVTFHFAGIITSVDRDYFLGEIAHHENIVYVGEYDNPGDLPRLYGAMDFAWALDLENVDSNSRWLMPCRFYEAGFFGVPCLAVEGFEIGRVVDDLDCGWTFAAPYEDALVDFFQTLTPKAYTAKRQRLASLPSDVFVASEGGDGLARILR